MKHATEVFRRSDPELLGYLKTLNELPAYKSESTTFCSSNLHDLLLTSIFETCPLQNTVSLHSSTYTPLTSLCSVTTPSAGPSQAHKRKGRYRTTTRSLAGPGGAAF